MIEQENELPEWTARRIAWREEWDRVRPFIDEMAVAQRIEELFNVDSERARYRSQIALGVFTSARLANGDLESLQEDWSSAMIIIRERCPEAVADFREYFRGSVEEYARLKDLGIRPEDFGF